MKRKSSVSVTSERTTRNRSTGKSTEADSSNVVCAATVVKKGGKTSATAPYPSLSSDTDQTAHSLIAGGTPKSRASADTGIKKVSAASKISDDRKQEAQKDSDAGLKQAALGPKASSNLSEKELRTPANAKKSASSSSSSSSSTHANDNFISVLSTTNSEFDIATDSSPKGTRSIVLRRSVSNFEVNDDSWLPSSLIDLAISKMSRSFPSVHYMSVDFVVLSLSGTNTTKEDLVQATDISGRKVDYTVPTNPIVFVCNSNNIHWNLIRIVRGPKPELHMFEPMGKPTNRHGGLGFRDVPRGVVRWLDICCPLENGDSWITRGVSAITTQQQFTPFDCGIACLLYAEKCGLGQTVEQINSSTSQHDLTEYRKTIQDFTRRVSEMEYSLED